MFEFDVLNYFSHYNTLDIDFETSYELLEDIHFSCSKEKIERLMYKIKKCKNNIDAKKEDSNKKGYHIRLYCKHKCDKCRLVFDDYIRFNADQTRRKEFTNIIFDTKRGY